MIVLDSPTKSLEVVLGGATTTAPLEWTITALQMTAGFLLDAIIADDGVTTGATPVEILAAPAATKSRQLKLLTVYNADTVDAEVTLQLRSGANLRREKTETLAPGESLYFVA